MPNNVENFNFAGRRPSKAQVISKAKQLATTGADFIDLTWGENWITLTLDPNGYWIGAGWFRELGGDFVAREINHCPKLALQKGFGDPMGFLRDHLKIVHIGGPK